MNGQETSIVETTEAPQEAPRSSEQNSERAPDTQSSEPATDFSALSEAFEKADEGEYPTEAPISEPEKPTAPAVPEPAVPPTQQPAEVPSAPPVAPVPPVPSQPQADVVAPPTSAPVAAAPQRTPTPEEFQAQRTAARTQLIEHFEKAYTIPPEEATLLATEPEKVLPKMAAKMIVDIYEGVTKEIYRSLPPLIHQVQQKYNSDVETAQEFYREWPHLNRPELQEAVVRAAYTYRQLNPQADPATMRRDVGRMVSSLLDGPVNGAAPSAPVSQAPVSAPHVPVGTTAAGVPMQQRPSEPNFYVEQSKIFERLAEIDDDED